jgi:hypothetical protein
MEESTGGYVPYFSLTFLSGELETTKPLVPVKSDPVLSLNNDWVGALAIHFSMNLPTSEPGTTTGLEKFHYWVRHN